MQLHPQYYYQQLPPPERAAYHGMLTCLRELAPSARIPRLTMETLGTLFFQLRLDHPEIFYAVGFSCRAVPEAEFVDFCPEYRFDKKRIREHRQAIVARTARLLRPLRSLPPAVSVARPSLRASSGRASAAPAATSPTGRVPCARPTTWTTPVVHAWCVSTTTSCSTPTCTPSSVHVLMTSHTWPITLKFSHVFWSPASASPLILSRTRRNFGSVPIKFPSLFHIRHFIVI